MSNFFSSIFKSFSSRPKIADIYVNLRNMVFSMKPNEIGLNPDSQETWGVIMETGYPEAVASLIALADGTVSLYFSNGGGIIGLGPHPGPQRISKELIALSQQVSNFASVTREFPLPAIAYTRFYFLMGNVVKTIEAQEEDLGYGNSPLSPLFHKGHELITEIRIVDQSLKADGGD